MKVIGIVTARGGSKGIPHKNLAMLGGKPLLGHTAEVAIASGAFSRIILSTDSEQIAEAGRNMGLECPFLRPPELARDDSPTIPVLQHVVRWLESEERQSVDAVFTLQPTNPLRLPSDITGAIELLQDTGADSVIGFSNVGETHPARMKTIDQSGRVHDPDFGEHFEGQRRQELEDFYLRDGSVYLTKRNILMDHNSLKGQDCRAWIIPRERACNIDEPFDLLLGERLLALDHSRYPGYPFSDTPRPIE